MVIRPIRGFQWLGVCQNAAYAIRPTRHTGFIVLFISLLCLGPTKVTKAQERDLIPRTEFFIPQHQHSTPKLSRDGQFLIYWETSDAMSHTFVAQHMVSDEKYAIPIEGRITDILPMYNGGACVTYQQGVTHSLVWIDYVRDEIKLLRHSNAPIRLLHVTSDHPDRVLIEMPYTDTGRSFALIDLLSATVVHSTDALPDRRIFFDDQFNAVAAQSGNSDGGLSLYVFNEGRRHTLRRFAWEVDDLMGGLKRIISVSGDGRTVFFTDNRSRDKTVLMRYDMASGQESIVVESGSADILPFSAMISDNGQLQYAIHVLADSHRHFLDDAIRADFDFLTEAGYPNLGFLGQSEDGGVWLFRVLDAKPFRYLVYARKDRSLHEHLAEYGSLFDRPLASRKAHLVEARDGQRLPVHVYLPPGSDDNGDGLPDRPLPTVLYVHGGPWLGIVHFNQWFHKRNLLLLADRGYAVINAEFRGSTGLGKAFTDAGDRSWGGVMHHDLVDIGRWALAHGIAKRDHMAIWGWSYGGYAVAAMLAYEVDLFECGLAMYGIADLESFCRTPFADNVTWRERVGDVGTAGGLAILRAHSPQNAVEAIQKPMLLTTGSLDARVPQAQYDRFAQSLHDAGKEVIYFYYPEERHDYRQPASWISFWSIGEAFLAERIGGRAQSAAIDKQKGDYVVVYGKDFIDGLN